MVRKNNNIQQTLLISLGVSWVSLFIVVPCFAGATIGKEGVNSKSTQDEVLKETMDSLLMQDYTYVRENRTDPFKPFLSEQKISGMGDRPLEELTGMQVFEPGQLSLVAILFSGNKPIAMVQDSTGKGYIVSEGTKIGRHGTIEVIQPNVVVIKEWYLTTAGSKQFKNISMVLRKEGEK